MVRIQVMAFAVVLLFFLGCQKDESELTEKIVTYQLLCPSGIDSCYNDCGTSSGVSSGSAPTGEELRAFDTCTSQCDILCSTTFLFLAD